MFNPYRCSGRLNPLTARKSPGLKPGNSRFVERIVKTLALHNGFDPQ
jgi:hypothetical protein